MTDLRKAAEMALEVFEHLSKGESPAITKGELVYEIAALRQALAQPEQEPMAWLEVKDSHMGPYDFYCIDYLPAGKHKLYTAPQKREWVGLMKGVRVEGDKVIIATKDNDVARELCGKLIEEKNGG